MKDDIWRVHEAFREPGYLVEGAAEDEEAVGVAVESDSDHRHCIVLSYAMHDCII